MQHSPGNELFFAYSSSSQLRAETMRETASLLSQRQVPAATWEALPIDGRLLISLITHTIDESAGFVAEISDTNSNVLFELGYAIAREKPVWLAFDETDLEAQKAWKALALLSSVGRTEYGGSAERLVAAVAANHGHDALVQDLLTQERPRERHALFAPSVPIKFTAVNRLERALSRKRGYKLLASGDDLGLASLAYYVSEIYRSSAALIHLMKPTRSLAREHNARASLMAGFAAGWRIPLLMVAEEGFESPLDYKDLLYTYTSTRALIATVEDWLGGLSREGGSITPRRVVLEVELPIRTFGQYVAENESDSLDDYFIETNEYRSVVRDEAQLFVGRKGTGKTAAMTQACAEVSIDKRNLVVAIKPTSYELAALVELISQIEEYSVSEYLLHNLWQYLLVTELAITCLDRSEQSLAGTRGSPELSQLTDSLAAMGVDIDDDFATRLDKAVAGISDSAEGAAVKLTKEEVARGFKSEQIEQLSHALRLALHDFARVAIFIDNLDKTWEPGARFDALARFLLGLLTASGRLKKQFGRSGQGRPSVNLTIATFLRTDIYDFITKTAREPDKINPQSVQWNDEELLARVLEERYVARRPGAEGSDMWAQLFETECRGLPTRDYLLWRTLPRPRDIIYLGNAALTRAINRKHAVITEDDIRFAEAEYSKFAVDALVVESEAQGFDLFDLLFEFAGFDSTITQTDLDTILDGPQADTLLMWLLKTSFLGVEVSQGDFVHVEGEDAARRKLRVARRLVEKRGGQPRYRVHPAFRAHLEIRDDDLHNDDLRDVTLEQE